MPELLGRRIVLAARPVGELRPTDVRHEEYVVPAAGPGEVLVRTLMASVDPYMRMKMNDGPSYTPPYRIGEVMGGRAVAEVLASRDARWRPGDVVLGAAGWQTHAVLGGATLRRAPDGAPLAATLGVLGMPGFTAYAGLTLIGRPFPGETLVVAAAAGPVGSTVAQLASLGGARVIAVVGGPEKVAFVREELGVDTVLDHRDPDLAARLRDAAPAGVDVYFENVGGAVLDGVRPLLNTYARVPLCGIVSEYDAYDSDDAGALRPGPDRFPDFYRQILVKSLQIRGFIATEFVADHYDEFEQLMTQWVASGVVRHREDVTDGLDRAPEALRGLMRGANLGKAVIRVADH